MNIVTQIKKKIEKIEFSARAKEKIDGILAKAELRKIAGKKDEECLDKKDKETLKGIIMGDMVLDAMEVKSCQAVLEEVDKAIAGLKE